MYRASGTLPPVGGTDEMRGLEVGVTTVRRVETDVAQVALTFDDGPDPTYTAAKLKALADRGLAATFFVCGKNVDRLPEVARMVVGAGSELANHSYNHPWLTGLRPSGVRSELERTGRSIASATGRATDLFRPPYGAFNAAVLSAAAAAGCRTNVLWDVDPSDYLHPPASAIAGHVLSRVRPGSIVVLHDFVRETASALPVILDELRARGLEAVTVSALLSAPAPGPEPAGPRPGRCRTLSVTTPYMRGDDVLAVQRALRERGIDPGPLDGVYGPLTARAVAVFQTRRRLAVSGVVSDEVYRELGVPCP
ncbi:MAG TPA: hypothetical protein DHW14_05000 [Clostridiales bacterium]|nr:hypothetical protein [Clostridiales bacterium]